QAQVALQKTLDSYNSGLRVTEVSFQNVAPPNEVKDAFDDVNNAREDKQSIENGALAYASKVVPVARGDAARIAAEAVGYKAERIARAQGDTARFDLLLKEYEAAPEVTRKRLWLETMEQVMADNPKVIDGSDGRNIINLPAQQGGTATSANADSSTAGVVVPAASSNSADKGAQP
ncbi:MAG TPA: FtsH protease activity modulator HflK, partial [Rhodanobacter sp.]|nr:FtsH protease activity modulator HflK [Rhodanobacter sp.]